MIPHLPSRPVHPALWALAGLMVGVETLIWAADNGLAPALFNRAHAYAAFAFWDPLFEAALQYGVIHWQLVWSFLTSALLHGGWLHLGMNVAAFVALGHAISRISGIHAALVAFATSAAGGVLVFGLLSDFQGPMVGASGAVFGYLGVLTSWQERSLRRGGYPRDEVWQRIAGLVLLNLLLNIGLEGALAWEAHLGGFIAGWLTAYRYPPAPMRRTA